MSIYRTKFEGELGGSWDNIVCYMYVCGGGGGGAGRERGVLEAHSKQLFVQSCLINTCRLLYNYIE